MNFNLPVSVIAVLPLVATSVIAQPIDPLVVSINGARSALGRPVLQPLPAELLIRNDAYLLPLLETMVRTTNCDHDLSQWKAFQAEAAKDFSLGPTSEVIACPRASRVWDPGRIVGQWLASPVHAGILLNRPRLSHVGCLKFEADGRSAAICTFWSEVLR